VEAIKFDGFVFLSITKFSNDRECAYSITIKQVEFRNDSDIVVYVKVCSCAPAFHLVTLLLDGLEGIKIQNLVKFAVSRST